MEHSLTSETEEMPRIPFMFIKDPFAGKEFVPFCAGMPFFVGQAVGVVHGWGSSGNGFVEAIEDNRVVVKLYPRFFKWGWYIGKTYSFDRVHGGMCTHGCVVMDGDQIETIEKITPEHQL